MKRLMLLALIAGASSVYAAANAAAGANEAEVKHRDGDVELGHAPANHAADPSVKAKKAERAARKAANSADMDDSANMFAEPANYGSEAKPVKKMGRFANFRKAHPYAFFGILAVTGAGIVGWIVNKFVVSKKEAQAEVASATQNPALEAQQNVAAQFKPSAKKAA